MSVIRVKHNRENPYVLLNKQVLFDENLSLKAKGLWAQCMARPDNWIFHVPEMVKFCKEGRRAIYSGIKELIKNGYAARIKHTEKNESGQYVGNRIDYIFFEFIPTPDELELLIEEFKKSFRECGFGNLRNGNLQNSTLLSKDTQVNNDEKRNPVVPFERDHSPSARPPGSSKRKKLKEEKLEVATGVWLTNTQQNDILARVGGDPTKAARAYDKLSIWKISKGIVGGSDYKSILNWVLSAIEEDAARPKKEDLVENHRKAAQKVIDENPNNPNIVLGEKYIEFKLGRLGVPDPHLVFGDNGFMEQLENNLRRVKFDQNDSNASNSSLNAPKIYSNARPLSFVEKKKKTIFGHKETAEMWNGLKWNGMKVSALENEVQLSDQSGIRTVKYSVSNEEWKSQTGWD